MSTATITEPLNTNAATDRLTETLEEKLSHPATPASLQSLMISTQVAGTKCCTK
jgi:hypothetical protein